MMTRVSGIEERPTLKTWLFNPFHYVAGGVSLGIGLPVVLLAGLNGSLSLSNFDGVLDFHTGYAAPRWCYPAETLIDWLVMSVLLLGAGWILSKSRIRIIDVFGTQALARTPTLVTALAAMLPGYQRQIARLALFGLDTQSPDLPAFIAVCVVSVVMIGWMVLLMYRAFSVSCNVRGVKAIAWFVAMLVAGEVISKMLVLTMFQYGVR